MFGELIAMAALMAYGAMLHKVQSDKAAAAKQSAQFGAAINDAVKKGKKETVIPADQDLADVLAAQGEEGACESE